MPASDPLWYKDAIVYELHVKAFRDSNGDGRGDFRGLRETLDYLQDLGVTALWLLPFYPSPQRDDGYDIADYRGVHPDYGSLGDFKAFVREAHRRGLRVITELVVNHTSDQHPWFQAARRARPESARRDFYVWSDTDQKFPETRIIFTDTETSNWAWDSVAGAYYWHRFFSHQPDLNLNNPRVVQAVARVLRFWLDLGVDGLRLDAVPYLCVREGTNNENLPETHAVIKELRRVVDAHFQDRMLLAEANQWPADVRPYFGDGDECHMAFHFPLMPRIFMAVRQEDRRPIVDILEQTPEIPETAQWALFLRNHDELTLEMVTDEERDYMYQAYARDARMRVNVGIRRRLAPLLDNSRRRIELLNSLLFSFPGTPVLYYGDELGMGDNIYLGDRDAVRTPMQWSADRNAGFSRADPARIYLPPIMDPVYGHQAINVEAQQRDPSSLLHFMKRLIGLRRQHRAFGRGTLELLAPRNRKVLAYLRRYRGEVILCVANLSRFVQPCELDLSAFNGWTPVEMIGRTEFPPIGELPYFVTLGPHEFFWFQLAPQAEPIQVGGAPEPGQPEPPLLSLDEGLDTLFDADHRFTLMNNVVAPFLQRQRWFQGKAREVVSVALGDVVKVGAGFYVVLVQVTYHGDATETYAMPLKIARGGPALRVAREAPATVLARLRAPEGAGVVYDALADQQSCALLLSAMADGREYATSAGGRLIARGSRLLDQGPELGDPAALAGDTAAPSRPAPLRDQGSSTWGPARRLDAEQSNTSVVLGEAWILKLFRRIETGSNPDLEVGRFLTNRTRFKAIAPVAGSLELRDPSQREATLAVLQRFVPNQGDGWDLFQGWLAAYRERVDAAEEDALDLPPVSTSLLALSRQQPSPTVASLIGDEAFAAAALLGQRTAELHLALASAPVTRRPARRSGDRAARRGGRRDQDPFAPAPMSQAYLQTLADTLAREARDVLKQLSASTQTLPAEVAPAAHEVLSAASVLLQRLEAIGQLDTAAVRIRCHGDYHLGQVLRTNDDFIILDFEGEPLRPLPDRRRKQSPLRDVAGMLRSFSYAAHAAFREPRPDPTAPSVTRAEHARRSALWERWVAARFLGAYLETAADAPFLPPQPHQLETLLSAFLLAKALYEVRYELNNRPDWLGIPLAGVQALLAASGNDHEAAMTNGRRGAPPGDVR